MSETQPLLQETPAGALLVLAVVPMKQTVLFPHVALPALVGRAASVEAVKAALATEEKTLVIVTQRNAAVDEPKVEDLYTVGTRAVLKQMTRSPEGMRLLLVGVERVVIEHWEQSEPFLRARVRVLPTPVDAGPEVEARARAVMDLGRRVVEIVQPDADVDLGQIVSGNADPLQLAYVTASLLPLPTEQGQKILEADTRLEALRLLNESLVNEIKVLELRKEIAGQAASEMSKSQREYLLRQQLRAIQAELGEADPQQQEAAVLRERLEQAELPEAVRKEAERELSRLERLPPAAPDYQITRSYLELVLELPWKAAEPAPIDLDQARAILDEDHFDLQEVKDRILEDLAVMKLNPGAHAPILCFVGPPGVGKTSLGQSIARALHRKFERLSLGGVHDEAELRGHRRTYIGAMPGRVLQALRRAATRNPVLMLDEVDKLGRGFQGDPASALLEVLDPAQNGTFRDNYLDLPFDLSQVFFVTTANTLDTIPRPLLDRMEVLRLAGYAREEKVSIARRYLIPRRLAEAGLKDGQLVIPDATLARLIARYTREAGVRELERVLGRLARKVARRVAEGRTESVEVSPDDLAELLGEEKFLPEEARRELLAGVATGLAWTESGGEVLYVEAALLPGGKELRITGSIGEVMRESATAAQTYVWSHAPQLGIRPEAFEKAGVHLHVPAGAVPKDGPSAGVAMATALTSLYTNIPARRDTAMTGEISLAGLVLPVGGIKEKVLAAHRAGLRRVVLPQGNERDVKQVPDEVRRELEVVFATHVEEVLDAALTRSPVQRGEVAG